MSLNTLVDYISNSQITSELIKRISKILKVIFFVLGIIFYNFLVNNICLHKQINLYLLEALTIQWSTLILVLPMKSF